MIAVRTRGEIHSVNSMICLLRRFPILASSGLPNRAGRSGRARSWSSSTRAQQEQNLLERNTTVRTVDSEIIQTKASHQMVDEQDAMNLMTAQYNLERAKLDASKAEVVSQIEGAKSRIDVGISEGELKQVNTVAYGARRRRSRPTSTACSSGKTKRSATWTCQGLSHEDGAARSAGRNRQHPAEFPRAGFVRIRAACLSRKVTAPGPAPRSLRFPTLSNMRIDLKLEEVDRGKLKLGQKVRVRMDAIADRELTGRAGLDQPDRGREFPRHGSDGENVSGARDSEAARQSAPPRHERHGRDRHRERSRTVLLIPVRASFMNNGKPAVYVQHGEKFVIRPIEVGKRNDTDMVVLKGLREGEQVALENPIEAAKRAKKL